MITAKNGHKFSNTKKIIKILHSHEACKNLKKITYLSYYDKLLHKMHTHNIMFVKGQFAYYIMLSASRVRDRNSTIIHIAIHVYIKPLHINAPAGKLYISIYMVKNLGSLKNQLLHINIM